MTIRYLFEALLKFCNSDQVYYLVLLNFVTLTGLLFGLLTLTIVYYLVLLNFVTLTGYYLVLLTLTIVYYLVLLNFLTLIGLLFGSFKFCNSDWLYYLSSLNSDYSILFGSFKFCNSDWFTIWFF